MWKIGDIEINSLVVLGPMAGITSLAYRNFMKPFGVGLSVSEMVSDCGLDYGNKKTFEYIKTSDLDRPVAIQLFGSNKDKTIEAIKILESSGYDYDILDINLGCPVPKVTSAGSGSSWLKLERENELYEYMSAIVKASNKPVTAKIRLGWDDKSINVENTVKLLEKAGVKAIALHCRTAKQSYTGNANYEIVKDLGKRMNIPLIISGDIYSLEDAIKAKEITAATAIMVARGGVGNPQLIKKIDTYFKTGEILNDPSLEEQIQLLKKYVYMLVEEKGETTAMMIARGVAPKFLIHYPNTKSIRVGLAQKITNICEFERIIAGINK